ncbi:DUF305 domain-containing protein [Meiothermus sp. QL-1]|uniref:DUF305 domain-containing protein n=1 Tax=Meiothermus sp. QL-1 TaxID=2058095 RepID=UPI000E09FF26|nr:DUF305 domain-containing protein [Meiothermus sp. QL-1]RDI95365.1 DUF305 domain-containing protein [Meiothermus sp. QL-1]
MHAKMFGFVAALLLGWGLAQSDHGAHGGMAMQSMTELKKLSGRDFDIAYMSMMIEHHRGAVEMAEAILKLSKEARIRKAAQEIIAVQNKEIAQLTGWLKAWYGVAPSPRYLQMMRAGMEPMQRSTRQGMQTGRAERAFLEGMIPHHEEAVAMSRLCLQKAGRLELKRFCQEVIALQSREVAQFRAWLEAMR